MAGPGKDLIDRTSRRDKAKTGRMITEQCLVAGSNLPMKVERFTIEAVLATMGSGNGLDLTGTGAGQAGLNLQIVEQSQVWREAPGGEVVELLDEIE